MLDDVFKKLADLYTKTGMDWDLEVNHVLTEPVAPTVTINPDGMQCARYRVDCDSIEQGIIEAVERVYREVILGEVITPMAPFTNRDDVKLEGLLAAWRRGEKPQGD